MHFQIYPCDPGSGSNSLFPNRKVTKLIAIRLIFLFSLIVLSGASVRGQTTDDQIAEARRRVVGPPKITRLSSAKVRVPLVGTMTVPLVEATLNGKGPYRLLVDTGANVTLLQMKVAEELKLPVLRPGTSSRLVALDEIRIGGGTFKDVVAGARAWDEDIDGVIGFNLFADCLLKFDYPRQIITFERGSLGPANGKDIFKYELDNRSPVLEIGIGDQTLKVLLDTGAKESIIVTDKFAERLRFLNGLVPGPELSTFDTAKSRARIGRLSGEISIGIHKISEPKIYVWNDVPVVGGELLKDFVLTFDQKHQTVKVSL